MVQGPKKIYFKNRQKQILGNLQFLSEELLSGIILPMILEIRSLWFLSSVGSKDRSLVLIESLYLLSNKNNTSKICQTIDRISVKIKKNY